MKVPIKSIEELKQLAKEDDFECLMVLSNGMVSRKYIKYDPEYGYWFLLNFIDESEFEYANDSEFIEDYPLFFEAINNRALIYDDGEGYVGKYI